MHTERQNSYKTLTKLSQLNDLKTYIKKSTRINNRLIKDIPGDITVTLRMCHIAIPYMQDE